jgi:hypothetical protein
MEELEQEELQKKKIIVCERDIKKAFTRLRFIARVMVSANKSNI